MKEAALVGVRREGEDAVSTFQKLEELSSEAATLCSGNLNGAWSGRWINCMKCHWGQGHSEL